MEEINGLDLSKTEKKKLTLSQETLVGLEITGTCTIFSHTPYCNRITCYILHAQLGLCSLYMIVWHNTAAYTYVSLTLTTSQIE